MLGLISIAICHGQVVPEIIQRGNIVDTALFDACHASTLEELFDGRIMAAWFGGAYEGHPELCIYTAIFSDGRWDLPKITAIGYAKDGSRQACWNPVLFKSKAGKLYLFYKVGPNPREWLGMMKFSTDDGITWSEAKTLPAGFYGPIRSRPLQFSDSSIICPSSTEHEDGSWQVHLERTDGDFFFWKRIEPDAGNSFDVIQPVLVQAKNDSIQMLCRSKQNCIVSSWSGDQGYTWDSLRCSSIPNPNAAVDAISLINGGFLLVYNPTLAGSEWWEGRNELRLAWSENGINWIDILVLEKHNKGEYSYPALLQTKAGNVHLSYTLNRKNIHHVVIRFRE